MESFSKVEQGSDKSFGVVFCLIFLLLGLYRWYYYETIETHWFILSALLLFTALIKPSLLSKLNFLWFKFGIILGAVTSPIILFMIYIIALVPTSILVRIFRKDILSLKYDEKANSYWVERKAPINSMKDQF